MKALLLDADLSTVSVDHDQENHSNNDEVYRKNVMIDKMHGCLLTWRMYPCVAF